VEKQVKDYQERQEHSPTSVQIEHNHSFSNVTVQQKVKIPLNHRVDVKSIHKILSKRLLRYVPELQGVVMAFDNIKALDAAARISYQPPYQLIRVQYEATLFAPRVQSQIFGTVTHIVPNDSVSLSVLGQFQASIPFYLCTKARKPVLGSLVEGDVVRFHVHKTDIHKTEISFIGIIEEGDGKVDKKQTIETNASQKKRKAEIVSDDEEEEEEPAKKKSKK
jgi:DNA-directed RNA polymerase subunit E'/Rpb7